MNDDQYIVGQFARITHMALPEDQWLVGRVGRIAGQSVINDEIASVLIAIDDTDEFVNAGDFALLTSGDVQAYIDGLIEANTDALGTVSELQTVLRNIIWTIDRAGNTEAEQNHALGWIKYHANEALNRPGHVVEAAQPTTTTQENTCDCGNYPVVPGHHVCDSCEFARDMYPDLFEDDEPDEIEVTE